MHESIKQNGLGLVVFGTASQSAFLVITVSRIGDIIRYAGSVGIALKIIGVSGSVSIQTGPCELSQ